MADNPFAQVEATPSKAYTAQLASGQHVHIQNDGHTTTLTLTTAGLGQQQQSASNLSTGVWTLAPQLFQVSQGYVLMVANRTDKYCFQIQGGQVQGSSMPNKAIANELKTSRAVPMEPAAGPAKGTMPPIEPMTPVQPMQPMAPMKPMTMGNMSMSPPAPSGGMSMTMGNMHMNTADLHPANTHQSDLSEDIAAQPPATAEANTDGKVKRFCSQCGGAIAASDRFCAYCGHQLTQ